MSRYNFHCIVKQFGSSPFPVSALFFFFIHFFLFTLLENKLPKKNVIIIIIIISSKPNKFIKIFFFHFSSSLTYGKTLEKFLHIIYIYIFSLSNNPNKFIEIYFIHFFFDPSVQHFLICYSPSIQIIHTTHNNPCYTHHSHINHQSAQGMCDLTCAHQVLGNRIPNLLTLSSRYL